MMNGVMKNIEELKDNLPKPPKVGDIMEGKIIGTGRSSVYLNLGNYGTGIIYGKEFLDSKETIKNMAIGDNIFAKVIDLDNEEGFVELSLKEAGKELNWTKLTQSKETEEMISVKILNANKGGLLTEVFGIPGFIPVSQLSVEHYPRVKEGDPIKILEALQKFIGQELKVKILDVDPKEEKLILSEKAVELSKIRDVLKTYKVGDVVDGEITSVVDFGAFIKFGPGLEGLIHISELDWKMINHPSEIVQTGNVVKAKIVNIAGDRVFLSLKALQKDPWEEIAQAYKKDDVVEGTITRLNPFGAFVEVAPKIQGLCHISEFQTASEMEQTLKLGQKYRFQILQIDFGQHRMILRLAPENV